MERGDSEIAADFRRHSQLKESAANRRERRESNLIRVHSREFAANFIPYLQPSRGITGHAFIAIIAMLTGATSCVKGIKGPQELRRVEEEE